MSKLARWPSGSQLALRTRDREVRYDELRERVAERIADPLPLRRRAREGVLDPLENLIDLHASRLCHDELLVATSGTTGEPRWARLSWDGLLTHATCVNALTEFGEGDGWLNPLPLHHIASIQIFMRAFVAGGHVCVVDHGQEGTHGCSHASVVARMLETLEPAAELRHVMVGGGPTSERVFLDALDRGIPVHRTYGLTEASSTVALQAAPGADAGDCGEVLPVFECRIEDGEIWLRGQTLFRGYEGEPERDRDAWFRTGDRGQLDGGRLIVTPREDRIVTGGENVSPHRVEEVLRSHPGVKEACVVGVDDDAWGQRVVAVIEGTASETALRDWCRQRLEKFEVPKTFHFGPIPRTETGKLQRRQLLQSLVSAFALDADAAVAGGS